MSSSTTLRLGTRGSLLARTQSGMVADELMRIHPGLRVELVIIKTTGDKIQDKPLADAGGKGLFTKELEHALLTGEVDFAVHSYKDVPVTMPLVDQSDLIIAAVPKREDPRDALISTKAQTPADLPRDSKVGTGSLRRKCQLLELRPDLKIENIRGNVDTRIRKMRDGEFDAVILAVAGLKRSGLFDVSIMHAIDALIPAAAQGALAIQCRKSDSRTRDLLAPMNDPHSKLTVDCERAIVQELNGDCHSPIAALATVGSDQLQLKVAVGGHGGELPVVRAEASATLSAPLSAVKRVMDQLNDRDVHDRLHPPRNR
jgi:hydroxymethylbilane synthase